MRTYEVHITGKSALLMHHDDIAWADKMEEWKLTNAKARGDKEASKAGDDRTPAWRWIGSLYKATIAGKGDKPETLVVLPTDNIMAAIMKGAATVLIPGGKNGKTFKADSQSGVIPTDVAWPIIVDGKPVSYAPVAELLKVKNFSEHQKAVERLGFDLFLKRAKIGTSKHVRVRPRFERWEARGTLNVTHDMITDDILQAFLDNAGNAVGIGDWRPGSPKAPGPYGRFDAKVTRVS